MNNALMMDMMGLIGTLREQQEIHVWSVWLDPPAPQVAALEQLLSSDERERAERLVVETDRTRFIVGRGMLRILLAYYLPCAPESLLFRYGPFGKPALDRPHRVIPLNFSISHSENLALYAFSWGAEVGIDVEHCRPVLHQEKMVHRFFTPREQEVWQTLPEHQRQEGFFRCWTRKEAYLKACGTGLTQSLRSARKVEVSLDPEEPAALLHIEGDNPDRWAIWSLAPAPGFCGALVTDGRAGRVVMMDEPKSLVVGSSPSYAAAMV